MQNLIVLGLVPGTNVQITFGMWLIAASVLAVVCLLIAARHYHLLRNWLIATYCMSVMRLQKTRLA